MIPARGDSLSAINLNSVDLPLPFSPTRPIRSPSSISRSISEKTGLPPKSLLTPENVISNMGMCLLIICNDTKQAGKEEIARRQMNMQRREALNRCVRGGRVAQTRHNSTNPCSHEQVSASGRRHFPPHKQM